MNNAARYTDYMYRKYIVLAVALVFPLGALAATMTKNSSSTGNVRVVGALSKGSGTFMIDHPLDPKRKLLYHSFVESPEVKNIYDGIVTLDKRGQATVTLPEYFMALNGEYRYLATPLGNAMPNLHLGSKVHRRWFFGKPVFAIVGGTPGGQVSWQVTGVRYDPYIKKHPIVNEVSKAKNTIVPLGQCVFEPLCK
ncbi:hypothetical protein EBR66_06650 [bacterium]|nr:hypothetical protein [bacterium]